MKHLCVATTALTTALLLANSASAQDNAQGSGTPGVAEVGEIIVTATRQETLASRTPVALTAIGGEALTRAGVTNPTTLGEVAPNLSIDRGNAAGLQISIRGVSSTDNSEKGDPSAAFMIDGVYIARPQVQEVSFFDLQRAEVLRGPQGTLFGRNTTAGLVNLISNKPKLDTFGGSIDASYGNFNAVQVTGVLNMPVSASAALRAAVNYDRRDSYILPGPNFHSSMDPYKDNLSLRLSGLYKFDKGELVIRGDYAKIQGTTVSSILFSNFFSNFTTNGVNPTNIASQHSNKALRTLYGGAFSAPVGRDNKTWGLTADLNYDLGPVTAYYLGSYREFSRDEGGLNIRNLGARMVPTTFVGDYWQQSHELRFALNSRGPLQLQFGGYFFQEQSSIAFNLFGFGGQTPNTPGYVYGFPQDPTKAKSYAGFAQATYSVTEALRLTAGARYSRDEKSRVGQTVTCSSLACDQPTDTRIDNRAAATFSKATWRLGVDYDIAPGALAYATISTGYKAGGFNDGCEVGTGATCTLTESALYYDPETLTSYEAGLKARVSPSLRVNLSAFHYDYKNLQLSQQIVCTPAGGTCANTTNAAAAKIDGVELEGQYRPTSADTIDFTATWLHARYGDYTPPAALKSWSGLPLDRAPRGTMALGYQHRFALASGASIDVDARTRLTAKYRLALIASGYQVTQPGFSKTDATVTYNAAAGTWYVQGFIKNIEDKITLSSISASVGQHGSVQISDPRTFGVRAGVSF